MKTIIYILFFVCTMQIQAQKIFKIVNLSANTVRVPDMITATANGGFPQYHTKNFSPSLTIAPFATFTISYITNPVNNRFPFLSTTTSTNWNSLPGATVGLWERYTSATAVTLQTSTAVWLAGSLQVFYKIQLDFGAGTSSKIIGIPASGAPATLTSNGWTASYALFTTGTQLEYRITIQ